jgi:molecular chaperone Hsp33
LIMRDTVQRFLLEGASVRGEIVSLDRSWLEIANRHELPAPVLDTLGELSAAAVLLAATLKFEGALVLQIHGDGAISLIVVEARSDGRIRATVKVRDQEPIPESALLPELVNRTGKGRFAVTLDPAGRTDARQAWQGIVPFEGETVAEVLEHYMSRSEQLPTRLWLAADRERASGLLLQRLPDEGGKPASALTDPDGWNRLQHLAGTMDRVELLSTDPTVLLERIFWQEPVSAFQPRTIHFGCGCSRDKVSAMLRMLGTEEIAEILAERSEIEVHCDYCNEGYRFDAVDCAGLFIEPPPQQGSSKRH